MTGIYIIYAGIGLLVLIGLGLLILAVIKDKNDEDKTRGM